MTQDKELCQYQTAHVNFKQLMLFLVQLSEQYPEAALCLSTMYKRGCGMNKVTANSIKAAIWLRVAAHVAQKERSSKSNKYLERRIQRKLSKLSSR